MTESETQICDKCLTENDIKEMRYFQCDTHVCNSCQYRKGFDDAIDKVRKLAYEQAEKYAELYRECPAYIAFMKRFDVASVAITDFDILIHHLFQTYAVESKAE